MIKTGIYKITNLTNGKFYIGRSVDIYRRWREHVEGKGSAPLWHDLKLNNFDSYVKSEDVYENFKFEIIEECQTIAECIERENYYINTLKPQYNSPYADSKYFQNKEHSQKAGKIFIAYHNFEGVGNYFPAGHDRDTEKCLLDCGYGISTKKLLSFYNIKGAIIYMIVGIKMKSHQNKRFFLWSKIIAHSYDGDYGDITVYGDHYYMRKPILLNDLDEYRAFQRSCGDYRNGFQPVSNLDKFPFTPTLTKIADENVLSEDEAFNIIYSDWIDNFCKEHNFIPPPPKSIDYDDYDEDDDENETNDLIDAIYENDINKVKKLIKNGTDLSIKDEYGNGVLKCAIDIGNIELIEYLLNNGADIHEKFIYGDNNEYSDNMIQHTISSDDLTLDDKLQIISLLIKHGLNINEGEILENAIYTGEVKLIKYLINNGINIHKKYVYGDNNQFSANMIEYTISFTDFDFDIKSQIISLLIRHGLNINKDNVLVNAIDTGDINLIEYLIDNGINIHKKPSYGDNFLEYILTYSELSIEKQKQIIKLLIKHGLNINEEDILANAIDTGDVNLVEFLLDSGANVKEKYIYGDKNEYVENMLEYTLTNNKLNTDIKLQIMLFLVKHGLDINEKSSNGNTLLTDAILDNEFDNVVVLCDLGININTKDDDNETALDVSISLNQRKIKKYLLEHGAKRSSDLS